MQDNKNVIIGVIVVVLLFISSISNVVLWQRYNSKAKEVEDTKRQISLQASIDATRSLLDEMNKREKDIYPQLLAQKSSFKDAKIKLDAIQAKLNLTGKDVISAEIFKMDINTLSSVLTSMGYPNTAISFRERSASK